MILTSQYVLRNANINGRSESLADKQQKQMHVWLKYIIISLFTYKNLASLINCAKNMGYMLLYIIEMFYQKTFLKLCNAFLRK